MKCEYCGNNLQIEDKVCPFCGKPNPFAKQHQREMARFSKKFEETRSDVLEQSARFNRRTVRITILAVLVALCAVLAFLCAKGDDIRYARQEKAIEKDAAKHSAALDKLIEAKDYSGLYHYLTDNRYSYSDGLRQYDAVYSASMYYKHFYEYVMILNAKAKDATKYTYYTEEGLLEDITKYVLRIRESLEENPYHPEMHTPEKVAYIESICDTVRAMLRGYLHLTEEEAAQIFDLSSARLNLMLEEAYERE